MSKLKQSAIKEIASAIALGHTCYIHKFSAKITIIDHSIEDAEMIAAQEQTQIELEQKIEHHLKIEKLSTEDQLAIMKDFLVEISDRSLRKQLSNALNRKNPVRNFKQTVESDIGLNQHWKKFNTDEYQQWVSNFIIDAYNY